MSTRAATQSTRGRSARQSSRTRSSSVGGVQVLEAVGLAERHRLVAQQVDPGVVGGVAARRGLQLLAADLEAVGLQPLDDPRRAPRRSARCRWPCGCGRGRGRLRGSSRRRPGRPVSRSRRTSPWPGRPRRTRPGRSCTASCPSRSARRGRGGTPSPGRTPRPARRSAPASARARRTRRRACGPPRTTWCCRARGRRRSRALPQGKPFEISMERMTRFELATSTLGRSRSTN